MEGGYLGGSRYTRVGHLEGSFPGLFIVGLPRQLKIELPVWLISRLKTARKSGDNGVTSHWTFLVRDTITIGADDEQMLVIYAPDALFNGRFACVRGISPSLKKWFCWKASFPREFKTSVLVELASATGAWVDCTCRKRLYRMARRRRLFRITKA